MKELWEKFKASGLWVFNLSGLIGYLNFLEDYSVYKWVSKWVFL